MSSGIPLQTPTYEVRDFKVFFGNQYLPDAKSSDFQNLGQGYGLSSYLSCKIS